MQRTPNFDRFRLSQTVFSTLSFPANIGRVFRKLRKRNRTVG